MAAITREQVDDSLQWPEQGQWTYADWLRLPDDEFRYELFAR